MIRKEKRRKILNPKISAKNNIKVNLVGNRVIFMEISKQVMIFIKNIQISNLSKIAKIAQRKISIHLGEIFIKLRVKVQKNGRILIKNKKNNKSKKIKKKKKKEKSLGTEDILKKKKIFLENIIMEIRKILKKMLEIKI
jgi:hypothetical protein